MDALILKKAAYDRAIERARAATIEEAAEAEAAVKIAREELDLAHEELSNEEDYLRYQFFKSGGAVKKKKTVRKRRGSSARRKVKSRSRK